MQSRFTLDWILVEELAIGPAPRKARHLDTLRSEGIKGILSLCHESEVTKLEDMNKQFFCKRTVLPDHKSGRMPKLGELKNALKILKEMKEVGPIFVHCVAAMERSPLVCMAWLVKEKGLSMDEALDYMMQIHPGTNPLPGQLELIKLI